MFAQPVQQAYAQETITGAVSENVSEPARVFVPASETPNVQTQYANTQTQFNSVQRFSGSSYYVTDFVEKDERLISEIGNSIAQNFLTLRFLGSGGAALTDKRFYYNGKAITTSGFSLMKTKCIVELSEITGVEIVRKHKLLPSIITAVIFQIAAVIFYILLADWGYPEPWAVTTAVIFQGIALFAVVAGIISIKQMLCIMFKGGSILFPVRLYGFAECNEFLRRILLARKALLDRQKTDRSV